MVLYTISHYIWARYNSIWLYLLFDKYHCSLCVKYQLGDTCAMYLSKQCFDNPEKWMIEKVPQRKGDCKMIWISCKEFLSKNWSLYPDKSCLYTRSQLLITAKFMLNYKHQCNSLVHPYIQINMRTSHMIMVVQNFTVYRISPVV